MPIKPELCAKDVADNNESLLLVHATSELVADAIKNLSDEDAYRAIVMATVAVGKEYLFREPLGIRTVMSAQIPGAAPSP